MLTEVISGNLHVTACLYACNGIQNPEFGKFLIKNAKISNKIPLIYYTNCDRCNKTIFVLGLQLFLKKNMHLSL
jgi:hypothetical protein